MPRRLFKDLDKNLRSPDRMNFLNLFFSSMKKYYYSKNVFNFYGSFSRLGYCEVCDSFSPIIERRTKKGNLEEKCGDCGEMKVVEVFPFKDFIKYIGEDSINYVGNLILDWAVKEQIMLETFFYENPSQIAEFLGSEDFSKLRRLTSFWERISPDRKNDEFLDYLSQDMRMFEGEEYLKRINKKVKNLGYSIPVVK